jgi:hypothetical protein
LKACRLDNKMISLGTEVFVPILVRRFVQMKWRVLKRKYKIRKKGLISARLKSKSRQVVRKITYSKITSAIETYCLRTKSLTT